MLVDQVESFRAELLQRVDVGADAEPEQEFTRIAGEMLEEAEECVDFMVCRYRGTGTHRKLLALDGYAFDDADGSLRLVVTDFSGGAEPETVTITSARTVFARATAFVEEALAGSLEINGSHDEPARDLAEMLEGHRTSITRLRFYLVTDGLLSDRIRDWPEQAISGIASEFHIWDASRFHAALSAQSGREPLSIDFASIVPDGIPCIQASLDKAEYSSYLCVLPGALLAQVYETYGSRLLEGNVRSFLGKTGKVNRAIRETISARPEMFFAFNNGIAATAATVEVRETPLGLRLVAATDLQIVNGGQTTASLAFTRRSDGADLTRVFVPMKLSVVSTELAGELIPKISEYANRQNKVADSDLFSNHEFHRRMEELSRRMRAPVRAGQQRPTAWFYERVKGQYRVETSRMSPAEKKRFDVENPRNQLVSKTDLAKVENSFRQLPHDVCKGAQKNFDLFSRYIIAEWQRQPLQFNDQYFRNVVAHTIVFKELEQLIPMQTDWYDGGYRAQTVTYSIAKLAQLIQNQGIRKTLDVGSIWKEQAVSVALADQLAEIARQMFLVITSPEQGMQNVTEWCKKELAWQRASEVDISLMPQLEAELVSFDKQQDHETAALADARVDVGLAAITAVLEYKNSNWKRMRDWAIARRQLTPKEDQLLLLATMPGKLPSEKQATAILKIRAKVIEEGFT